MRSCRNSDSRTADNGGYVRLYPVFGGALREALGNIPSLRLVAPVRDPDLVHLVGAARFWAEQARK